MTKAILYCSLEYSVKIISTVFYLNATELAGILALTVLVCFAFTSFVTYTVVSYCSRPSCSVRSFIFLICRSLADSDQTGTPSYFIRWAKSISCKSKVLSTNLSRHLLRASCDGRYFCSVNLLAWTHLSQQRCGSATMAPFSYSDATTLKSSAGVYISYTPALWCIWMIYALALGCVSVLRYN